MSACAAAVGEPGQSPNPSATAPSVTSPATGPAAAPAATSADPALASTYAAANNAFGFELWQRLRGSENLAIAPASLSLALGMTWAGARGETAAQMSSVLHMGDVPTMTAAMGQQLDRWNEPPREGYQLTVVDRLFGEKSAGFEPDFLALMRDNLGAPLEQVDFIRDPEGARARINGWVEDQTKDRIRELLPPGSIETLTRLVLTNAVYFKADWRQPFDRAQTRPAKFFAGGTKAKRVPMMHQTAAHRYAETDTMQVVELAYGSGDLALDILLPKQKDGLDALERGLDAAAFDRLVAALDWQQLDLAMPKVKLEMKESLALAEVLKAMGMAKAFTPAAEFAGISTEIHPLFIDDVYHKTFVALDEQGTEAAAATAVVMKTESAEPPGVPFVADHPFVFVLRDTSTGVVMFIGRVVDPS